MIQRNFLYRLLGLAALVVLPITARAIPPQISVSGRLEDATNRRSSIDGTFVGQIDFYGSEASTTVLYTSSQSVTVTSGVFSSPVTLPNTLLTLDSLYYTVSIDLDNNGLDAGDLFATRFQVSSVPYTLGSGPTPIFLTAPVQQFPTIVSQQLNDIQLVDFVTPPGGLRFSHMALNYVIGGSPGSVTLSYAIYDSTGHVVAGPAVVTHAGGAPWAIDDNTLANEVTLEPTTRYFAAFATNNAAVKVPSAFGTSIPFGRGFIPDGAPNGVLPSTFNPAQLQFNPDPTTGVYASIALFQPPPPPP